MNCRGKNQTDCVSVQVRGNPEPIFCLSPRKFLDSDVNLAGVLCVPGVLIRGMNIVCQTGAS